MGGEYAEEFFSSPIPCNRIEVYLICAYAKQMLAKGRHSGGGIIHSQNAEQFQPLL